MKIVKIGRSAVVWRKVLLVLKVILRYGHLKGFFILDKKISLKKGLKVSTPKNLKWKKCIRQSENANGRHLEPLWGLK